MEGGVRRRPFTSSGRQVGLRAEVTVSQVDATGTRKIVASSVNNIGGGGDPVSENVEFTLDIPLDSSERDAAIREYLAAVTAAAASLPDAKDRAFALRLQAFAGPTLRAVHALPQTFP